MNPVHVVETQMMDAEIEQMIKVAEQCAYCRCGCCKDECPMYSEMLEETISPKGRNFVVRALMRGLIEPDERVVRIAYSCLLCRRDEQTCVARLKNAEATETLRRYLVEHGAPLPKEHEALVKSLENYGNPWQEPRAARKRWARELQNLKAVNRNIDTLFYVGCTFALDRSLQDSPKALARIMQRAGERFGVLLEDEVCCGSTAKRIGHAKLFERLRSENEERLLRTGARRIVTACAGCYKTMKQDYPGFAEKVEILHATEYIERLMQAGKLPVRASGLKVTYHDPCHLGRHSEVYDAPRRMLKSVPGLELIEMESSRELSRCCGGGAGVKTAYPEISHKAALARLRDAERMGASMLVTACPFCVQSLRAAAESSGSSMRVVELAALLEDLTADRGGRR